MSSSRRHWYSIDLIKGILIFLVFLGHLIPGTLKTTFPRYIIYSFHMPLFIGISGFLFNPVNFNKKIVEQVGKYWKRIIFPWSIAVVFYYVQSHFNNMSIKGCINAFIKPFYHLWYILAYLCYLFVMNILWGGKKEKKWIWLLLIAFVISIISKWELINVNSEYEIVNTTYKIIVNDFRPHNFIFFVLGMYLGEVYRKENVSFGKNMRIIVGLAVAFGFITTIVLFFNHNNFLDKMNFFVIDRKSVV